MSVYNSAEFFADAKLIAGVIKLDLNTAAYLATGGSDGCSLCKSLDFAGRVGRGHLSCAESLAATKGAKVTVAGMSDMWITISRAMADPRFGKWIGEVAR